MLNGKKINVLMDTSPLGNGHSGRGIGVYTRLLSDFLEKRDDIELRRSGQKLLEFKPQLIHYPYFDLFFATLPWRRSKPTVVTVHDVIPLKFPEAYLIGAKGQFSFWKQSRALKSVQAVITDSLASKADIISHLGVKEDKIHVVYLAADPRFKAATETQIAEARKKYSLPKTYILYVGDINFNKNIPQLIKAVKFLPEEVHLVCVGKNFFSHPIPEWHEIETQIALSNVADKVTFLTNVYSDSLEDLSSIYSGALAYVQPSLYEGFGLPVLEAMQCRTPVICSRNSSLVEVGGEFVEYVEPLAQNIAKAVEEIFNWSKTRRISRTREAYQWSQQFSWERVATETAQVYHQVLA